MMTIHPRSAALIAFLGAALCAIPAAPARTDTDGCIRGVEILVKRGGLDVSKSQLRDAVSICRRTGGNLEQALRVLDTRSSASMPRIVEFKVRPSRVRPGEFVSFFWRVEDATQVTLSDRLGVLEESDDLTANGFTSIALSETTTFRLVAEDRQGRSTARTFTVDVVSRTRPRGGSSDGCENLPPNQRDKCGG